jgi:hypothetical protein
VDLRCNWGCVKGGLPFRRQNVIPIKLRSKVLSKLRNTKDGTCGLLFETDEDDGPASVDAPSTCPWIHFEGRESACLVVLLVGEMTKLLALVDLDVIDMVNIDILRFRTLDSSAVLDWECTGRLRHGV